MPRGASRSWTTTYGTLQALAIRAKSGMFPLPPHSSTRIPSLSESTPSASKTSGNVSFSVRPSTSTAQRARNSSARLLSNAESARKDSASASGSGWKSDVPPGRRVAHEGELLELVDAEEDRRVGRVEDLVPRLRQPPQEAVEVALGVRAEVELRLLDQEHEVAEVRGEEALHPGDEREPAVGRGPVAIDRRRLEELGHLGGSTARRGRDEPAGTQIRRQEEHRWGACAVEVERVGRPCVEEDRPLRNVRLEPDPPTCSVASDVVDRRRRRGGLEQRPDRRQHGGLPARCLSDERADGARRELELAGRAIPLDRDSPERRHRAQGAQRAPRYTAGSPGCQRPRNRWIGGWSTTSSRSAASKRRWPRTAASVELTRSSERPERSAAKMMWTTCLPMKARLGAIESTTATGPSNVRSSPIADLLLELAPQRLDEAFAAVDAAARQQPVLAAPGLLVPAEQDAALPAEDGRDPDARLERHQWAELPKPFSPRSLAGSSCTSTGGGVATGTTTS